jgi:hypothetical protein
MINLWKNQFLEMFGLRPKTNHMICVEETKPNDGTIYRKLHNRLPFTFTVKQNLKLNIRIKTKTGVSSDYDCFINGAGCRKHLKILNGNVV